MSLSMPSTSIGQGRDDSGGGGRQLPYRVIVMITLGIDASTARRSLFRPCKAGGPWRLAGDIDDRYSDFDPRLAEDLRQASPHFTTMVDESRLRSMVGPDLRQVEAAFAGRPVRLELRGARLGLTDLGYGATALEYEVTPHDGGTAVGAELVDLSLVNLLMPRVQDLISPLLDDLCFVDGATPDVVTCLWGHLLYALADGTGVPLDLLAPDAEADGSHLRLDLGSGFFKPGLGSSVVAGADDPTLRKVSRVLALASAYYAAAADFDRLVFGQLRSRLGNKQSNTSVFDETFEEVSVFRAVLSTLDLHLAASTATEVRIWGRYAEAWRLAGQLDALNEKLTLLRTFQDREATRISLHRAQNLSIVAAVFTVLGFVGVMMDLVDFGQADGLARPDFLRTGLSLLFVAVVIAVFALWARIRAVRPKE